MTAGSANRRFLDLLGVRLGLVLGLALLPVGLVAVAQSADLIANARNHSEAALAGETLRAIGPGLTAIKRAQGAAEAIAALRLADAETCNRILARIVAQGGHAAAAVYAADGSLRCRSPRTEPPLSPSPTFSAVVTRGLPALAARADEGGENRLAVLFPESDDGGAVSGVATVTLPPVAPDPEPRDGFALLLFDRTGTILLSSVPEAEAQSILPEGNDLTLLSLPEGQARTFSATSLSGEDRAYSLVEVTDGEVFALGSWPQEIAGLALWQSLPPLILPALMWAVSLVVAWVAAEKLVTRHIRRLRGAILDFADGSRSIRPIPMQNAPQEIRDTAEAFARMAHAILRDEADLEDALHGKEVLLREVHHRVKNNLQLIASIVNMQIRRTRSDEARRIMRSLQERMLSLATIHNGLYQTADVSEIRADRLFPGIVEQIVRASTAQGRNVRVTTSFDDVTLSLDQAVPLALLMTEALSNALRFATTRSGELPALSLSLRSGADGKVVLQVTNDAGGLPVTGVDPAEDSSGIGTQLLRGFSRQLGGTFQREFADGECRLSVRFMPGAKAAAA